MFWASIGVVALCGQLLASSAPAEPTRVISGSPLFKDTRATRAKVQRMLGAPPIRCTSSTPERWLCTWRVEPGDAAHSLLAAGQALEHPIHFLCSFPAWMGSAPGRCTSHRAIPLRPSGTPAQVEPTQGRLAREAIDSARTIESLSRLIGAGPDDCRQRNSEQWVCYWSVEPNDPGYSTLGALVEAAGAARLICLLPLDGGERGEDSCRITSEPA